MALPKVTTIGGSAFSACSRLTTVNLPQAVSIGNTAFQYCGSLVNVNLPEAATIGNTAFSGCTGITTVTLPKITSIGNSAFSGCTSLTTITLGTTPPATIGTVVFSGAATTAKTITIKTRYPGLYTYAGTPWSDKVNMANSAAGNFWDNTAATRNNLTVALAAL
jgi:hypothetical protein